MNHSYSKLVREVMTAYASMFTRPEKFVEAARASQPGLAVPVTMWMLTTSITIAGYGVSLWIHGRWQAWLLLAAVPLNFASLFTIAGFAAYAAGGLRGDGGYRNSLRFCGYSSVLLLFQLLFHPLGSWLVYWHRTMPAPTGGSNLRGLVENITMVVLVVFGVYMVKKAYDVLIKAGRVAYAVGTVRLLLVYAVTVCLQTAIHYLYGWGVALLQRL